MYDVFDYVGNMRSFTLYSPFWPQLLSENRDVVIGKDSCIQSIDPFPRIGCSMGGFTMVPHNNTEVKQVHMHTLITKLRLQITSVCC